jgi:hypothetical protein
MMSAFQETSRELREVPVAVWWPKDLYFTS